MKIKYSIYNKISDCDCNFDSIRIDKNGKIYAITDNPQEHYENELSEKEYEVTLEFTGDLKVEY
jgi:hypothetical protein